MTPEALMPVAVVFLPRGGLNEDGVICLAHKTVLSKICVRIGAMMIPSRLIISLLRGDKFAMTSYCNTVPRGQVQ
jgi:hypothetical protein